MLAAQNSWNSKSAFMKKLEQIKFEECLLPFSFDFFVSVSWVEMIQKLVPLWFCDNFVHACTCSDSAVNKTHVLDVKYNYCMTL
jgi:hypothetical protein